MEARAAYWPPKRSGGVGVDASGLNVQDHMTSEPKALNSTSSPTESGLAKGLATCDLMVVMLSRTALVSPAAVAAWANT